MRVSFQILFRAQLESWLDRLGPASVLSYLSRHPNPRWHSDFTYTTYPSGSAQFALTPVLDSFNADLIS